MSDPQQSYDGRYPQPPSYNPTPSSSFPGPRQPRPTRDEAWRNPAPTGAPTPGGWDDPRNRSDHRAGKPKMNTCAVVGFILSFLLWLVGLIVSIVALVQINHRRERGKGLAVAGIIISIIMGALSVTAGVVMGQSVLQALKDPSSVTATVPSSKPKQTPDAGSTGTEGESKKQELSAKPFPSMQALAESQLFQAQMKTAIGSSFDGTGAQITYRGEGDTLVMDIALPAGYDQVAAQLGSQMDSLDQSGMQQFVDTLPSMVATQSSPKLRMLIHTSNVTVWDHTWTAQ
ncbi:hypothetical protein CSQ85_09070 [Bifidobacterium rousetti]|uniref:DUF4190 domain-containing protein n=1 Tax=Bifidobacterium rousetti TaxID=2045439 RepID=UPI001239FDB7|nr:DUF4190 domain-containing protein [Bifidobacterium rousetti]KAA8818302.1 hypothetical protein CSQ85_09070 [Bifidobacterium rousetti]